MHYLFTHQLLYHISKAKLRVFHEVTADRVWKSFVAKMQQLNHSKTTACKEKCYMSERNGCGKVMDVTSDSDDFLAHSNKSRVFF